MGVIPYEYIPWENETRELFEERARLFGLHENGSKQAALRNAEKGR
jgi:hypothetical protein